ncbi:unnamed protein product, partial [marine sediment metagenome]
MNNWGDTERQARLRDKLITGGNEPKGGRFESQILGILTPHHKLLDIGCGTGHIIVKFAREHKSVLLVGLDISSAMVKITSDNSTNFPMLSQSK